MAGVVHYYASGRFVAHACKSMCIFDGRRGARFWQWAFRVRIVQVNAHLRWQAWHIIAKVAVSREKRPSRCAFFMAGVVHVSGSCRIAREACKSMRILYGWRGGRFRQLPFRARGAQVDAHILWRAWCTFPAGAFSYERRAS
jgi:hypothetical protein